MACEDVENPVKGQLTVSFGSSTSDDIPLVITGHQGFIKSSTGIPFRVYPYDNDTRYDASYGEIEYESNHEDRVFEVVRFSGGTEATFSKYPDRIDTYELLGRIIAAEGDEAAEDGGRGNTSDPAVFVRSRGRNITISYDNDKKALVATAPCFAVFKCFYYATYALVRYTPQATIELVSPWWGRVATGMTYGTIVAQLDNSFATHDVQPASVEELKRTTQLYSVITGAVANGAGLWELPSTGWPDGTPAYANDAGATPDPGDGYQVNSRIHQVGTININGIIHIDEYHIPQAAGPVGSTWLENEAVFVGEKRTNALAGDPNFGAAIGWISSADEAIIDTRLEKYNLEWDTLTQG